MFLTRKRGRVTYVHAGVGESGLAVGPQFIDGRASLALAIRTVFLR
jgi:hypothetical protein